jgi:hypothetical protein
MFHCEIAYTTCILNFPFYAAIYTLTWPCYEQGSEGWHWHHELQLQVYMTACNSNITINLVL